MDAVHVPFGQNCQRLGLTNQNSPEHQFEVTTGLSGLVPVPKVVFQELNRRGMVRSTKENF